MSLEILNDLFDRVYVLYLPTNGPRCERLRLQLAGVNVEWVEGVDASQHTLPELRERVETLARAKCGKVEPLNPKIKPKNMAIWLGQFAVRERIRQAGERSLVLEDDAWFVPDAGRRLAHYFDEIHGPPINDRWELLYLYRENPAGPIDGAFRRRWGGSPDFDGGYRRVPPVLPQQACQDGPSVWDWVQNGNGPPETCSNPRELIVRDDGSILDHVYIGTSERISTVAYAISSAAVEAMYGERIIWTNDWWVARLTEPGHRLRKHCYCVMPAVVWPRWA